MSVLKIQSYFIREAEEGKTWKIMILRTGWSRNNRYYPKDLLEKSASLFEGAKVCAYQFADAYMDHLPEGAEKFGGYARNVSGWIDGVKYENEDGKEGLTGMFHCTDEKVRASFADAWKEGKHDLLGFSIDALGESMDGVIEGRRGKMITSINKINEVTIVSDPAAGGELLRLVASMERIQNSKQGEKNMNPLILKLIEMVRKEPALLGLTESDEFAKKTNEEIFALIQQKFGTPETKSETPKEDIGAEVKALESAISAKKESDLLSIVNKLLDSKKEPAKDPIKESEPKPDFGKEALEKIQIHECKLILKEHLLESKLPEHAKVRISKMFEGKKFDEKELDKVIADERDYLSNITESGDVNMKSETTTGDNRGEKLQKALDLLIDPDLKRIDSFKESYKDIEVPMSLRRLYSEWTGDTEVSGRKRFVESATSASFTAALGTSMNRRMSREYSRLNAKESWGKFVSTVGVDNFKRQDIIRVGGFANLSTVAEAGTYTELSTPSEENPYYTPTKRGNTFVITREMIKNDDLRFMRVWPVRLANAANRTLSRFVFDLLTGAGDASSSGAINSDTIYDGTALYTTSHGNYTTTALSFTTLDAAITAMANQGELSSSEPLNIRAAYLVVPHELRSLAKVLVDSEYIPNNVSSSSHGNNEVNPVYKSVEPIVVPKYYLGSDANNWFVVGDPADAETIEIGFVDNKQEPEILIQDAETVATVFTADKISYKVRHEYSGAVAEYRSLYGGIVA